MYAATLTKWTSSSLSRYHLTHEDRGIEAELGLQTTHKDNDIGKYGIGAKEAVCHPYHLHPTRHRQSPAHLCRALLHVRCRLAADCTAGHCSFSTPWRQVFYLGDGVEVMTKHRDKDAVLKLSMSKVRVHAKPRHKTPCSRLLKKMRSL